MTDINEFTAKLKEAEPYEMKFSRLWERYDEACHGNAEHMRDILELTLDALETAERRITNSNRDVLALIAALEDANALNKHLELAIRKAEGCSEALRKRAESTEERLAELEAHESLLKRSTRTRAAPPALLTMKLPKASHIKIMNGECVHGWSAYDVICATSNAGIKLQIEGE